MPNQTPKSKPKKAKAMPSSSRAAGQATAAKGSAGARTVVRPPPPSRGGR